MRYIRYKLPLMFLFMSMICSSVHDSIFAQSSQLSTTLVTLLERSDTTTVKNILRDFSDEWLLLVAYTGAGTPSKVVVNFYESGASRPPLVSLIKRSVPFFEIFDKVLRNLEIKFEVRFQDRDDIIMYRGINPRCGYGCLSYVTLGEDSTDINELSVRIPPIQVTETKVIVRSSNWFVGPKIPIPLTKRKLSILTLLIGGFSAATYAIAKNEDNSFEDFKSRYNATESSPDAVINAINAERAHSRSEVLKTVSVISLAAFVVLSFNDIFIQSKPQKQQFTYENNETKPGRNFHLNFNPQQETQAFTIGVSIGL